MGPPEDPPSPARFTEVSPATEVSPTEVPAQQDAPADDLPDPREGKGLGSKAASGVAWLTAQSWVVKAGGFVTMVFLARLLTPTDFGLVAVAMTVVAAVYLISDLGFGTYLMQSADAGEVETSTAFWYAAISGLLLAGVLVASAPLLELFFGVPGAAAVISMMSPAVIFVSLAAVPIALLRRGMRFRALSIQATVAALFAQIVAIVLAVLGMGVWALVAQVLVSQGVTMAGAWFAARWHPVRRFNWGVFRTMFIFGTKVVSINAIATARLWGENAIITNVLGAAALGKLSIAQRLVLTSQEVAGAAITPVSTVLFAQIRKDAERLRGAYDRALGLAYVVIVPALTAILVTAPVLIPLLFGPQWTESVVPARALAVAAVFTLAASLDHGLFYGLGQPGAWLVYGIAVDALTLATTAFAVRYGINGVTLCFIGVAAIATLVRWIMVSRALDGSVWLVARRSLAALLTMAVSGLAGLGLLWLMRDVPDVLTVMAVGVFVLIVHVAVCWLVLRGSVRDLVHEIGHRFHRGESAKER